MVTDDHCLLLPFQTLGTLGWITIPATVLSTYSTNIECSTHQCSVITFPRSLFAYSAVTFSDAAKAQVTTGIVYLRTTLFKAFTRNSVQ
ncbi:hypothetical protein SCLCIDRAFT_1221226 [Scleroderma citrinum Foug A]|uniref:Uncharacterized protein n=1 Tax=Scleroderma citrinum Foug A TaxID=1036808 RepID=A0A0C2Z0N3_9AGAM|nr:hypothetical protein SCLCIDRAFT_1221226 [Scleroderma citrinum Foug A]